MSFFRLERFSVWRGQAQVVWEISLSVQPGEVLALAGSNGAGKTTLLEGLAGLHTTSGDVWLGGKRLNPAGSAARVAQRVSLCPDGRHLFTDMTVLENLLLGAYRLGFTAGKRRARAMAESVPWLRDRLRQRAGTLSGGEQQLVAVCRAMMSDPILLLLDAPTSGLGPAFRSQVSDLVQQFIAQGERAVLVADDDIEFLGRIASVSAVVSGGRFVSGGPISRGTEVAPFFPDMNNTEGDVK
jgi:branched-chain amino acid transport system ATP-binding protein